VNAADGAVLVLPVKIISEIAQAVLPGRIIQAASLLSSTLKVDEFIFGTVTLWNNLFLWIPE